MTTLHLHHHTIAIAPGHVITTLPGGAQVHAMPQATDSYRATALDLGYGTDTARMNQSHDLAHLILAHALGLDTSPVLRAVAAGTWQDDPLGVLALEEQAVAALLRFANALGVDLVAMVSARNGRCGAEW